MEAPYTVIERLPRSSTRTLLSNVSQIANHRSLAAGQPHFNPHHPRFIVFPRVLPERFVKSAVGNAQFVHDIVRGVRRLPDGELDWNDLMMKLAVKRAERKRRPRVCYTEVTIRSGVWWFDDIEVLPENLTPDVRIFGSEYDPRHFALLGRYPHGYVKMGIRDGVEFGVDSIWTTKAPEEKFGPELQHREGSKVPRERSRGFTVVILIGEKNPGKQNKWDVHFERFKEVSRYEVEFRPEHPRHLVIVGRYPDADVACLVRKATSLDGTSFCISKHQATNIDDMFERILSSVHTKVQT